jgi:hypothetical protein
MVGYGSSTAEAPGLRPGVLDALATLAHLIDRPPRHESAAAGAGAQVG